MNEKLKKQLKDEFLRVISNRLEDWDNECSWNRQASEFADHLIEQVEEIVPMSNIPSQAVCLYLDGNMWCACRGDFVDLQMSNAGFGATREDAISELYKTERDQYQKTIEKLTGATNAD